MTNYGFIRTASAVPVVRIADPKYNSDEICRLAGKAFDNEASLVVFPELSLTGYSCGDLFGQSRLLEAAEEGIKKIVEFSRGKATTIVAGAPVSSCSRLYNCAVVIRNGEIKGLVPKTYVTSKDGYPFASGRDFISDPDQVKSEIRYAGQNCIISPEILFNLGHATFAIEIGEDLWAPSSPSVRHSLNGAHIIANPTACCEILMQDRYRRDNLRQHTAKTHTAYIMSSAGFGESTQDQVFAGGSYIFENGSLMAENDRYSIGSTLIISDIDIERLEHMRCSSELFGSSLNDRRGYNIINLGAPFDTDFASELHRHTESHPFAPEHEMDYRCREIISIQTAGLIKRLTHINCSTAVIGISGGLDSTLALLVTALAFDRLGWSHDRIVAVTMPGFGTTSRTRSNAWGLMEALGVTCREISIVPAVEQHFKDLGHDSSIHDATYENSQARERTQILMDIANQTNGIVIGTGDLSELALGWATYNGDHMSMYGVNSGIPKTLVRSLVQWAAENKFSYSETAVPGRSIKDILLDIVDTPISPELLPADDKGEIQQVTEDLVGPYELHDFFIYHFMRNGYSPAKIYFLAQKAFSGSYNDETIKKWLKTFIRRFFSQQFKRSCMPDGPAVGSVSLSPRGSWKMPSDGWSTLFYSDLE